MAAAAKSILFISAMKGDPWGGSEEFWFHIAVWMAKNDYQVHCAFYHWPTGKEEKITLLKEAGCIITLLTNPKCAGNVFDKIYRKRLVQKELILLLQQPFNLVCISQGGFEEIIHPPFRKVLPLLKKFVLIYHNYDESRLLSPRRKERFNKWVNAAALNVGAAQKIFDVLKTITCFDIPNQLVLKNPLVIPLQSAASPYPALNKNGNYNWVVMAQLDIKRKAQDVLIKVLASEKWRQRNWELFLYGAGEDNTLLAELITAAGMNNKIHLMGHTKEVEGVLKNAHLLLQLTHIDAMPLSVTEAMNMARPCMVSNVGDMPLWVKDGSNGFVAAAITEQGIDAVLEKTWLQQDQWQQMGVAAFDTFQKIIPGPMKFFMKKYLTV